MNAPIGLHVFQNQRVVTFHYVRVLSSFNEVPTEHNIDSVEAGFRCPTMQYSNQDASRNNSVVM